MEFAESRGMGPSGLLPVGSPDFKDNQRLVVHLRDLSKKGEILDKTQMENQLNVSLHWYQYLQICNFIKTNKVQKMFKTSLTELETVIKK